METHNPSTAGIVRYWQSSIPVYMAAAVMVLVLIVAYSNTYQNAFVFDDINSIPENTTIRRLAFSRELLFPEVNASVTARPVLNFSLAVNYAIHGEAVWGYHLGNLAIHVIAALALFGIVRRTCMLDSQPANVRQSALPLAFSIALLWGVHPIQTSAVTYMIQRAESMMGMFYLLTLYFAIRGIDSRRPAVWHTLAITACALGMGTKEVIVSAPVMVVLYDRIFVYSSLKIALSRRRSLYLGLFLTWIILITLVWQTQSLRSAGFGLGVKWWQYAGTQFGVILNYLKLSFWPSPLILDYGIFMERNLLLIVAQAAGIATLMFGTIAAIRYQHWLGFLGFWFFAILSPSSSVMPLVTQTAAEHRMYLSLAAVVAAVVVLCWKLWRRFITMLTSGEQRSVIVSRAVPMILVICIAAVLVRLTYSRNLDYRTNRTIWEDTYSKRPDNFRAADNLGLNYMESGEVPKAIELFNRAIELNPLFPNPRNNLGVAYNRSGEPERAVEHFNKAIELHAGDPRSYNNRGNSWYAMKKYQAAIEDYDTAIKLDPEYISAYNNRGNTYYAMEQFDDAIADFTRTIQLDPTLGQTYMKRGFAYVQISEDHKAIEDLTRAIELLSPLEVAPAYDERGRAYGLLGQYESALADHTRAIESDPEFGKAYYNRGTIYARLEQYEKSISDFTHAVRLVPDHAMAFYYRGMTYDQLGQANKALNDYNMVIEIDPSIGQAYYRRARAYMALQQYDQAWQDVRFLQDSGIQLNQKFLQELIEKSDRSR